MEYMDDELIDDDESHQSETRDAVASYDPTSDDGSGDMVERKAGGISSSEKDLGSRV